MPRKPIQSRYPFNKAREGETYWITGNVIAGIGEAIESTTPLPDPRYYRVRHLKKGVAFTPMEEDPPSSSESESEESESSSESESQDSASISKSAIVPQGNGYLMWHCVERPDVIFEDVVKVQIRDGIGIFEIRPEFLDCIERGSLRIVSTLANGAAAWVEYRHIGNGRIEFRALEPWLHRFLYGRRGCRVNSVTVRYEGIRKGFANIRYQRASREEFEANEAFYRNQRPAKK